MNNNDRNRLVAHCKTIMQLWHIERLKANGNQWSHHQSCQAYLDCMRSLEKLGFIKTFNITSVSVTFPNDDVVKFPYRKTL